MLNMRLKTLWWFFVNLLFLTGCTSRYRLDLYLMTEGEKKKVKVEKTEFIQASRLNDPYADMKILTGSASTVVITAGTRWRQSEDTRVFIFSYDEYLKCRIYLQLPPVPAKDTIRFPGNSFVQVLGRYDLPSESKIFLADSGFVAIDSLTSDELFGTIRGRYQNREGAQLAFEGKFKVKIAD